MMQVDRKKIIDGLREMVRVCGKVRCSYCPIRDICTMIDRTVDDDGEILPVGLFLEELEEE